MITGVVALVLVLTGTVVFDAAASFAAALAVLTPVLAAWVAVFGVGWWRARGQIDPEAIQVFNRRQHGGPYWYTGGWSRPAIAAWAAGSGAGLLCVQSPYTGPLAGLGGGIDVSLISSAVVAAVVYLGLAQVAVQRTGARA